MWGTLNDILDQMLAISCLEVKYNVFLFSDIVDDIGQSEFLK